MHFDFYSISLVICTYIYDTNTINQNKNTLVLLNLNIVKKFTFFNLALCQYTFVIKLEPNKFGL